jgi:hypothetical protein
LPSAIELPTTTERPRVSDCVTTRPICVVTVVGWLYVVDGSPIARNEQRAFAIRRPTTEGTTTPAVTHADDGVPTVLRTCHR